MSCDKPVTHTHARLTQEQYITTCALLLNAKLNFDVRCNLRRQVKYIAASDAGLFDQRFIPEFRRMRACRITSLISGANMRHLAYDRKGRSVYFYGILYIRSNPNGKRRFNWRTCFVHATSRVIYIRRPDKRNATQFMNAQQRIHFSFNTTRATSHIFCMNRPRDECCN